MKNLLRYAIASSAALAVAASYAITLTDLNTSLVVNDATGAMYSFSVDGNAAALFSSVYFLRMDAGLNTLLHQLPGVTTTVTQIAPNLAEVIHENTSVQVRHLITLTGGGPGTLSADIAESVRVRNKTNTPMRVALFQYNDFDLDGAGDDFAELVANDYVCQYDLASPLRPRIDHTITGLRPALWKIGAFPAVFQHIYGTTNDLDNMVSPFGPADATYAFQISGVLSPAGQASNSMIIGSDKVYQAVPEPASMLGVGLGLTALLARRRR